MIAWEEKYSVGVQAMDEQHRSVLELLNKMNTALAERASGEKVDGFLSEMAKYAKKHFSAEEELLIKYKFYDLEPHRREHELYVSKMDEFKAKLGSGKDLDLLALMDFLIDWWTGHMLGSDKDYRAFLNNHGVF
jgi:hemerythrin-like metal-binding protein